MAARKELSGLAVLGSLTLDGSPVPVTGTAIRTLLLGVDGAGSGLDADLLDGSHASAFAFLTGATFTGTVNAPTLRVGGVDVWHPGNDGSGSGLDADTVDGDHASAFAKLDGAVFTGGVTATGFTGPGGGLTALNASQLTTGSVANARLASMAAGTLKGRALGSAGTPTDVTAAQLLAIILTVDGSTSGLDADLLDGDHATAFAKLTGATFTGGVTATGFTGPGGGLTGVNAASLGGTAASGYALLAGATFTGNVTAANITSNGTLSAAGNTTLQGLGVNGATPDATNKFAFFGTNMLFNSGGSIDATFNKAAAGNDASFSFKTGFAARALLGLLGDDNFTLKVGAAFNTALVAQHTTGRVTFPQPVVLGSQATAPAAPAADTLSVYARRRAGADWPEVMRPTGRDIPLQPHFGLNRVATWSPSTGTTVVASGMPRTAVGTASTPALASINLSTSMRRWRMTSAATANAVADERSARALCFRGNAAGRGGFTYTNRISLVTLQAGAVGFFGLLASTAALATTQTIAALVNCVGIGFTNGVNTNWQLIHNDGSGAPTLVDLGANFPVSSTTNVYTLVLFCAQNGSVIGVRVVNEVNGFAAEYSLSTDIPANTTFLSVRNYLNNGGVAAAVAYDCSGVYLETDY